MDVLAVLIATVAVIYALLIFWVNIPPLYFLLRPNRHRYWFLDVDEQSEAERLRDKRVTGIHGDLVALGFSFIGVKVEDFPLWGAHVEELSYANPARNAFASAVVFGRRMMYYFFTPFDGGGVALTASGHFQNISRDNCMVLVVRRKPASHLLEVHEASVKTLRDRGLTPVSHYDRVSRLESTGQYYETPVIKSQIVRRLAFNVFLGVCCVGAATLLFA